MKKLSLSQIAGMSCMIFAIFFGAGNMIFPPSMGQQAGTNAPIALLGFVLSDVGIAVAGVLAVVLAGTSMYELASTLCENPILNGISLYRSFVRIAKMWECFL